MEYKWLVLILILLFPGCSNKNKEPQITVNDQEITIKGKLEKGNDQLVTLDLLGSTEIMNIDSMRCDESGKFSFTFQSKGLNYYSLKYTEDGYITIAAEPGDTILLTGNAATVYPYEIAGSEASEQIRDLAYSHKAVLDQLRRISTESDQISGDANYSEKKQLLNLTFDSITNNFHRYSRDFIYTNPSSPAILIALYNQYGPGLPVFNPLTDLDVFQFVDSSLIIHFPKNDAVKSLHSQLYTSLQKMNNQQEKNRMAIGMSAPDFVLNSPEGKSISLSELRGKYVLLQIWASWSKPSVDENRYIEECYSKFNNRNFAILQVSIDSDKNAWLSAIKKQKPNWYHVSDLERWESAIINLYRIERIPANFLIDPDGKIVEIDKFDKELIQTLEKYLH